MSGKESGKGPGKTGFQGTPSTRKADPKQPAKISSSKEATTVNAMEETNISGDNGQQDSDSEDISHDSVYAKMDNKMQVVEHKMVDMDQGLVQGFQQVGETLVTLDARIRNLEIIGGFTRSSPADSPPVQGNGINYGTRTVPTRLSFQSSVLELDPATVNQRRDSVIGAVQTDALRMRANDQTRLIVQSEAHMKIRWTEKTLDAFIRFVTDISLFQQSRQQAVFSLFTHFSEPLQNDVENLLLTHLSSTYTDRSQVAYAPLEHIYEVLLHLFKPRDLQTFNELLFTSCLPYRVKRPPGDHKKEFESTRSSIYILKRAFMERYKFLVESAKKTNNERSIPAFSFKDAGLFQTWLLLTPTGMRQSFQRDLDRTKYDSLERFF